MDAKDSLKELLDVLHEFKKQHIKRSLLIDYILGNETHDIEERGWDKLETFGIGEKREELHYNMVIDQAIEEKLMKETDEGMDITPKGEKFRKSPAPFILKEEGDENEPDESDNAILDILVEKALKENDEGNTASSAKPQSAPSNGRSQQMVHLIQAIDRKVPLDDYAEQMQLDFDEVLDDLEKLVKQGVKLDISYFIDEVMEKDCQQELCNYLDEVNGDVEKAIEEFDGVYQPEEIRLARLIWR